MCALRFIDSFDHYVTGDFSEKYTYTNGSPSVLAGQGRRGSACLSTSGASYLALTLDAQPRWTIGMAMHYGGHGVDAVVGSFCELHYGGSRQLRVIVSPEGFVGISIDVGYGTVIGLSSQVLHTNVWYYVEASVLSHPSAGEATIHVDGVAWLTLTGVNTQPNPAGHPNQIILGSSHSYGLFLKLDDIYVCDGQGSGIFTTFLGDCRVDVLRPNADGTYAAWTPSAGATHYATVDDPAPNDDTDYVSVTTGGTRDSYQLEPLPTMPSPEVLAVQACISARKEDVDEILIKPLLVSGGVTSVASTVHELNASYKYALDLWTTDPNGGGAWTEAAVNSLQVGMERPA